MKKIIVFVLLLIVSVASFSQETKPTPALTKQAYLKKCKNNKTAAWVCLGSGTALFLTGMAVVPKDYNPYYDVNTPQEDHQYHFAEALAFTGFGSMLASIPLFIASHRNKKKSMSLSFKNEKVPYIQKNSFVYRPVPSLNLKMSL
jgi:hypothetical protein